MSGYSRLLKYWIPVLAWMLVIYSASTDLMSSQRTSRFIGPVLRWLIPDISDEAIRSVQLAVRKTAHFAEYGILAVLIWRALRKPVRDDPRPWSWREAGLAVGAAVAYACTDELHQTFVSSRMGSIGDVAIDAAGAVVGLALVRWMGARRRMG